MSAALPAADGFVVVSRWLPAAHRRNSYAYNHFETLAHAVAEHRRIVADEVRDFAPLGIFASRDGLPVGGALSMEAIDAVTPERARPLGAREYDPVSRENMMLRDSRPLLAAE